MLICCVGIDVELRRGCLNSVFMNLDVELGVFLINLLEEEEWEMGCS